MRAQALKASLVDWMRKRVEEAGAAGIAVGLSGGIDSAVVAGLAKEAFPTNVLGVIMPCHSLPEDRADALMLAEAFAIPTITVDLGPVWDLLLNAIEASAKGVDGAARSEDPGRIGLARANVKPRLRMTTLYYLAGLRNYLVAGTGNRVELNIGYFTKHGDGGVDLLPIGNLVKSEVQALARELGVPEAIISRAPSAGLWEGQTDEAEMGLTYDALDRYFLTGEGPKEVVEKIRRMEAASAHKRRLPPIPDIDPQHFA